VTALRVRADQGLLAPPTPRELDVLLGIARGDSIKQTARALGISPKTVESLQTGLFRKLGVRNRAQAVTRAHALGLVGS
jgi:LuxR family maltose regulon positive regulatory protein